MEGDFAARARLVKDKSVGRDLDRSVPLSDMLKRATLGFEMLVRSMDLDDVYRQHALSYMRFLQHVLDLEYMRQDYLMILTDEPNNRRALQLAANSSSAGAGISDRLLLQAWQMPTERLASLFKLNRALKMLTIKILPRSNPHEITSVPTRTLTRNETL